MKKSLLNQRTALQFFSILCMMLFSNNANAQTVTPYTSTTTWLCPAGVFSVQVECWGAGGGGGGAAAASTSTSNRSGGGGGAGSYVKKTIAVFPGTTYTVTVGVGGAKGGTSGASGYYGGPGGKSEFSGTSITALTASGGTGGTGAGSGNLITNPGGVLGGVYGFTVSGSKTTNYTGSSVVTLNGGGGTGAATGYNVTSGAIAYIAATNQGTGYTAAPSVVVTVGAGQTFTALVNPNINSSGADTITLGSNGGASSVSAGGAGGASPDGLGGFLAGGAGGTGTTVGTEYLGATPTNAGAGGGGGFSVYALSTNIPAPKSSNGGVGANGKIVLTYTATIPSISVTPATLLGFSTVPTAPSTAQTFSVSGSLLEADIVITAPTNYEINNPLVDGTYGSTITLTQVSGSVAATTINVRLKTGLTGATAYAGDISLTTTNGTPKTVACSGGVLSYYYYAGSGSLATVGNWSTNTDGVGGSQPTNFTTVYQVFVIRNTTAVSTDVAWNVAGTGSVIQVGDPSVPGVALTIASGLDISTTAVSPVVGNGTIDIPAASSGVNSVTFQNSSTPPGMGIMDANSEVHYQATMTTSTSKTFGKMFIENNSTVTFTGKPIVQTTLDVATGSTLILGSGTGDYVVVNAGATVAIDGSLKSGKSAGIFSYGVTTPGSGFGSIQFKDVVGGLTLGSSSTVEYNRTSSSTAQSISTLPTGVKYNNLTISDSGATLNHKLFSGAVTVNNTFTLNQSMSNLTACENLTLANGATIVRNAGILNAAPVFGTTVNVSYNGATAITSGFELPAATSVLSNLTINNNANGVTLANNTKVNGVLTLTSGTLTIGSDKNLTLVSTPTITAGTITNTGATVTFENTSAVVLPASLFTGNVQNLTINGVGGVTLGSATSLAGKLTVTSGVLNTAGFLTLKSSECCTASIGQLANGAVTGDVTVERYIPAKRAWRALTAPVIRATNNSIYSNWQNDGISGTSTGVDIWGPAGTGSTGNGLAVGPNSSMLTYNSSLNNWSGVTDTNTPLFSLALNNPFMVFVTGPYGTGNITNNSSAATTLRAKGSLIIGQQTYATVADKYTFIGNPYASPLSLSSMITTNNASFEGNIWIWDANTTVANPVGIYNLYNSGNYTNVTTLETVASTTEIQSGQAFFVRSTAGDPFIIEESNKGITNSAASTVFRDAAPAQLLRVGLYKQINTEWSGRDGAMTVILPDANANQTPNKMANGSENVAFTKNGLLFASEHHLPFVASDVLNVRVWNTTAGANYKLKINTEQFATTSVNATLEDLFMNSRTPLTLDGTAVEYPFAVTTEATSTGNRFRIVFENSALGINNPKATGISILPNPITGDSFQVNFGTLGMGSYSYSICNALGQEVEKGNINNVAQNTNSVVKFKNNTAAGMYIMKVTGTDNTVFSAKIIKK